MKLKHFFLFLFQLILRSHFHLFHVSGQLDVGIVESIVDDIPEQMTDHGGVSHVEVLHHLRYRQLVRQHVDLASELSVDCGIGISLNHSQKRKLSWIKIFCLGSFKFCCYFVILTEKFYFGLN